MGSPGAQRRAGRRWPLPAKRALAVLLGALIAALAAVAALPATRAGLWRRELNPILRGRLLAERQGCFACHRPWGAAEIPNPGSRWGSVPRFAAGNARMYVDSPREIAEVIRLGAPRAWLEDAAVVERLERQRLRMPAYGDRLSAARIRDLTAFAVAVEGLLPPPDGTADGRDLARAHGCFACHGLEGSGGLPNPGSLGGFVPGFLGRNYEDLVKDPEEFREWVLDGTSRRLEANPVVRFFWRRQAISMPAYRGALDEDEVERIRVWIEAARAPA